MSACLITNMPYQVGLHGYDFNNMNLFSLVFLQALYDHQLVIFMCLFKTGQSGVTPEKPWHELARLSFPWISHVW